MYEPKQKGNTGMGTIREIRTFGIAAAAAAALLAPGAGLAQEKPDAGDKAINARQGFMQLVLWNAGPLFGMAKGEVAYDAAAASARAANLTALTQYNFPELLLDGTSKADRPGKTRALPDIMADRAKFQATFERLGAAVATVAAEAGKGQAELAAAVGAMGKVCGDCHNSFRAKEF